MILLILSHNFDISERLHVQDSKADQLEITNEGETKCLQLTLKTGDIDRYDAISQNSPESPDYIS